MNFSVALCTYNGQKYLEAQLDSIAAQTLPPQELVVCDDCSGDETVALLRRFAARAPFPVHVHLNEHTLRSTKNFEKAIGLCSEEIIALSDQDDVWMPQKLERIAAAFAAAPHAGLVFTDAEIVDEQLRPLGTRLWAHALFTPDRQRKMQHGEAFEVQLELNAVTGATMAFRSSLREFVLPIPENIPLIHDGWIALLIAAVADLVCLKEPLILYRQHAGQQFGIKTMRRQHNFQLLDRQYYQAHQRVLEVIYERLSSSCADYRAAPPNPRLQARLRRMRAWMQHLQTRIDMPRPRLLRLPFVARELASARYFRYSNGLRSVARDLFYP